jgi:formylmethanofuran--tetrahydromethanopterin N-formyltransferase
MNLNGVVIEDTFAEAFGMRATRILITALNLKWAYHAAQSLTGFATSVIGCGCEAGIERELSPEETPDNRPGIAVLLFAISAKELAKQIERRVGQCVLTSPSSAVYAGLEGEPVNLVRNLRFFGDGYQMSKVIGGQRYWRVPVMDGEFLGEETTGMIKAVGGGNFLVLARGQTEALAACEAAIAAMSKVRGVIMPFPGGIVRSGSKIGSKYKALSASTNSAFCPTLRGAVKSELTAETGAVLEIVIDGLSQGDVRNAMRAGMGAACSLGAAAGVQRISAGNYGGKLGPFHFRLHEIMQ